MNNSNYSAQVEIVYPRPCRYTSPQVREKQIMDTNRKREAFAKGYRCAMREILGDIDQLGFMEAIQQLKYRKVYEDSISIIEDAICENIRKSYPESEYSEQREFEELEVAKGYTADFAFECQGSYWSSPATYDCPPENGCHISYKITSITLYDERGVLVLTDKCPCVEGEWEE